MESASDIKNGLLTQECLAYHKPHLIENDVEQTKTESVPLEESKVYDTSARQRKADDALQTTVDDDCTQQINDSSDLQHQRDVVSMTFRPVYNHVTDNNGMSTVTSDQHFSASSLPYDGRYNQWRQDQRLDEDKLIEENVKLQQTNIELVRKLQNYDVQISGLSAKNDQLTNELRELKNCRQTTHLNTYQRSNSAALQRQLDELTSQLQDLMEANEASHSQLSSEQMKTQQLEQLNRQLVEQLYVAQNCAVFSNEVERLRNELEHLFERNDHLAKENSDLKYQMQSLLAQLTGPSMQLIKSPSTQPVNPNIQLTKSPSTQPVNPRMQLTKSPSTQPVNPSLQFIKSPSAKSVNPNIQLTKSHSINPTIESLNWTHSPMTHIRQSLTLPVSQCESRQSVELAKCHSTSVNASDGKVSEVSKNEMMHYLQRAPNKPDLLQPITNMQQVLSPTNQMISRTLTANQRTSQPSMMHERKSTIPHETGCSNASHLISQIPVTNQSTPQTSMMYEIRSTMPYKIDHSTDNQMASRTSLANDTTPQTSAMYEMISHTSLDSRRSSVSHVTSRDNENDKQWDGSDDRSSVCSSSTEMIFQEVSDVFGSLYNFTDDDINTTNNNNFLVSVKRQSDVERSSKRTQNKVTLCADIARSPDVSSTSHMRAFAPRSISNLSLGDVIKFLRRGGRIQKGTVRYIGVLPTKNTEYIGVELDTADGKHDGTHAGVRYYQCGYLRGVFVAFNKVIMAWTNNNFKQLLHH